MRTSPGAAANAGAALDSDSYAWGCRMGASLGRSSLAAHPETNTVAGRLAGRITSGLVEGIFLTSQKARAARSFDAAGAVGAQALAGKAGQGTRALQQGGACHCLCMASHRCCLLSPAGLLVTLQAHPSTTLMWAPVWKAALRDAGEFICLPRAVMLSQSAARVRHARACMVMPRGLRLPAFVPAPADTQFCNVAVCLAARQLPAEQRQRLVSLWLGQRGGGGLAAAVASSAGLVTSLLAQDSSMRALLDDTAHHSTMSADELAAALCGCITAHASPEEDMLAFWLKQLPRNPADNSHMAPWALPAWQAAVQAAMQAAGRDCSRDVRALLTVLDGRRWLTDPALAVLVRCWVRQQRSQGCSDEQLAGALASLLPSEKESGMSARQWAAWVSQPSVSNHIAGEVLPAACTCVFVLCVRFLVTASKRHNF
jgi:hypothetical protein